MRLFYIWSIDHQAWWRPNWHGYTIDIWQAGLYEPSEAERVLHVANRIEVKEVMVPLLCTVRAGISAVMIRCSRCNAATAMMDIVSTSTVVCGQCDQQGDEPEGVHEK
jgi:hypothetical protein